MFDIVIKVLHDDLDRAMYPSVFNLCINNRKQASMLHKKQWDQEVKYEMVRKDVNMNNSVKWIWFEAPVKVKQINDNLFLHTRPT
jgi:hypothetical protein